MELTHHLSLFVLPGPVWGSPAGCLHDQSGVIVEWKCIVAGRQTFLTWIYSEAWTSTSVQSCDSVPEGHVCPCVFGCCKDWERQMCRQHLFCVCDVLDTPSVTPFCHNNVWMWARVTSVCQDFNLRCQILVSWIPVIASKLQESVEHDFRSRIQFFKAWEVVTCTVQHISSCFQTEIIQMLVAGSSLGPVRHQRPGIIGSRSSRLLWSRGERKVWMVLFDPPTNPRLLI